MKPALHHFGAGRHPVVTVDAATGRVDELVALAERMGPLPEAQGNFYPGLRRMFGPDDTEANAYVDALLAALAPFIGGGFDCDSFELKEASFSMVTAQPQALSPAQRAPHFDSTDRGLLAVLHYLHVPPGTGTAFYRHRATGIEIVEPSTLDRFVAHARPQALQAKGYIVGSDPHYEEIGRIEAMPDRVAIYPGRLLHSGIIPPDMVLSGDPHGGRLTANLFIQAKWSVS